MGTEFEVRVCTKDEFLGEPELARLVVSQPCEIEDLISGSDSDVYVFPVSSFGFQVCCFGFCVRVLGFGFRISGFRLWAPGVGLRSLEIEFLFSVFLVSGFWFPVSGFRVRRSGFCFEFRVSSFGFRV